MAADNCLFEYHGLRISLIKKIKFNHSLNQCQVFFFLPPAYHEPIIKILNAQWISYRCHEEGIQIFSIFQNPIPVTKTFKILEYNNYISAEFIKQIFDSNHKAYKSLNYLSIRHYVQNSPSTYQLYSYHSQLMPSYSLFWFPLCRLSAQGLNPINPTQKTIVIGTLNFIFDSLAKFSPKIVLRCLNALTLTTISNIEKEDFERLEVWDEIEQIRTILSHPCPQNRGVSYPYFDKPADEQMIVYKDAQGKPAFEQAGLLGLTVHNDKETFITKQGLVRFIYDLIDEQTLKQYQKIAANKIQFWYKSTRIKNSIQEPSKMPEHLVSKL